MISASEKLDFEKNGFLIVRQFAAKAECEGMLRELVNAIDEDQRTRPDVFDAGMVHNCFIRGPMMLRHLDSVQLREATNDLLCKHAIVYAFQSSSLAPGQGNFGSRVHVDSPRFIPGYRTNLGYILALQDFTKDNGATYVLPGSHRMPEKPSDAKFFAGAVQLECQMGDAIFFDARLWHAAGSNKTQDWRHGLTINFCRPYMRTRFDFPKLIALHGSDIQLEESARAFLGYDVRMPASLEEFYVPEDLRLYKPGQE